MDKPLILLNSFPFILTLIIEKQFLWLHLAESDMAWAFAETNAMLLFLNAIGLVSLLSGHSRKISKQQIY